MGIFYDILLGYIRVYIYIYVCYVYYQLDTIFGCMCKWCMNSQMAILDEEGR